MSETNRTVKVPHMTDEEFERFYAQIYAEFGPRSAEENTDLLKDVPVRRIPGPYDEIPEEQVQPKKKGVAGLMVLICLELLGIAGVAAWWVLRLL